MPPSSHPGSDRVRQARPEPAVPVRLSGADWPTQHDTGETAAPRRPWSWRRGAALRRAARRPLCQAMSSGRRRGHKEMTIETLGTSTVIAARVEAVFTVLADPSSHRPSTATSWSARHAAPRRSLSQARCSGWRCTMPTIRTAVTRCPTERPYSIRRERYLGVGQGHRGRRKAAVGGWTWRYDSAATESCRTSVTLTYDWTAVPRSSGNASHSRRFPWTTSPTRCATWPGQRQVHSR